MKVNPRIGTDWVHDLYEQELGVQVGDTISLELAKTTALIAAWRGCGRVAPNPMVGCVLLSSTQKVLGIGWHQEFGGPHAEEMAVRDASSHGLLDALAGATAVVTLEPCSHHGKRPPCVDLLLQHGIARVVYGAVDQNAQVDGRGLASLASHGVKCQEWGPGWNEALAFLHGIFFSNYVEGKTCVTLKAGLTLDASIARKGDSRTFITGKDSRRFVQFLRLMHDSVMIGVATLLVDNPQLTVRDYPAPRQPQPILFDPSGDLLKIDPSQLLKLNLFSSGRPLWVVTYSPLAAWSGLCAQIGQALPMERVLSLPERHLKNLPPLLWQRGISAVLLEGGRSVYAAAMQSQIFSQAFLMYRSTIFLGADRLNLLPPLLGDEMGLELAGGQMLPLGQDWCFAYGQESIRPARSRTLSQEMSLI